VSVSVSVCVSVCLCVSTTPPTILLPTYLLGTSSHTLVADVADLSTSDATMSHLLAYAAALTDAAPAVDGGRGRISTTSQPAPAPNRTKSGGIVSYDHVAPGSIARVRVAVLTCLTEAIRGSAVRRPSATSQRRASSSLSSSSSSSEALRYVSCRAMDIVFPLMSPKVIM
jgi:hypothetical protein